MGIVIDITGDKEILANLKKLSPDIQNKIARKAVLAQSKIVRDKAKSRVPVKSGKLRRGIKTKFVKPGSPLWRELPIRQRRDFTAYVTGVFRGKGKTGEAWYGVLVEGGTRKHKIPIRKTPKMNRRGFVALGRGGIFGKHSIRSPLEVSGTKKRPWLRPSFFGTTGLQVQAQNKALKTWLKKWKQGKFK